jgi:hypothetical protein
VRVILRAGPRHFLTEVQLSAQEERHLQEVEPLVSGRIAAGPTVGAQAMCRKAHFDDSPLRARKVCFESGFPRGC